MEKRLLDPDLEPVGDPSAEFGSILRTDTETRKRVIQLVNIKLE